MWEGHTHTLVCMWRSEDNLQIPDKTQVVSLGDRHLYLLSYLTHLCCKLFQRKNERVSVEGISECRGIDETRL